MSAPETYQRRDGREPQQMRKKELRLSELSQFDGSAAYSQGFTSVLAAVHGPVQARLEQHDRCGVSVRVARLSGPCAAGGAERLTVREEQRARAAATDAHELSQMLEGLVAAVLLAEYFPRAVVAVDVTVVQDDGALAAVAANAVMMALLDSGVPCRTTAAAVCVAALAAPAASAPAGAAPPLLLLDPSREEEEDLGAQAASASASPAWATASVATFVFSNPRAGGGTGVLSTHMRRPRGATSLPPAAAAIDAATFERMAALAECAAPVIFGFMRQSMDVE